MFDLINDYNFRQIQLITPNWLFGQRRKEDSIPTAKDTLLDFERRQPKFDVDIEAYLDLDNLSPSTEIFDQDVIERYFLCSKFV